MKQRGQTGRLPYAAVLHDESLDLGQGRDRSRNTGRLAEDLLHSGDDVARGAKASEVEVGTEFGDVTRRGLSTHKLNGWLMLDRPRHHIAAEHWGAMTYPIDPRPS